MPLIDTITSVILKIIPLPPEGERRALFVPARWIALRYASFQKDCIYVPYVLFHLLLLMGFAVLSGLLLDGYFQTGVILQPEEFTLNKLILPKEFSHLMFWPSLVLTTGFYLRVRLPTNLRVEPIPFAIKTKQAFAKQGQRTWIFRSLFLIIIGFACLFTTHILVIRVTEHYGMRDSLMFIMFPQLFALFGIAMAPLILIPSLVFFEKALRFFPDIQHELNDSMLKSHEQ